MVTKFILRLTEAQFFYGWFFLLLVGSKAFDLLFENLVPQYYISGFIPVICIVTPLFYTRYKAKPEEFPHLKGREKYVPYFFGGIMAMAVAFSIIENLYFV